jgi:hypothetical protein
VVLTVGKELNQNYVREHSTKIHSECKLDLTLCTKMVTLYIIKLPTHGDLHEEMHYILPDFSKLSSIFQTSEIILVSSALASRNPFAA